MTLLDDAHRQFPAARRLQHQGYSPIGDPPTERNGAAEGGGDAFRRQMIALLLLAVALAAILLAVPAPEVSNPVDAIDKSTTSAPPSKDTTRPRPADRDGIPPCSDLDYAYEKC